MTEETAGERVLRRAIEAGEEIPAYAYLAKRIRHPNKEEIERLKRRAEKLGLISKGKII